jgi:hypothetical protein
MNVRIVQNFYSNGDVKYEVKKRNWRGGYEEIYLIDGSGCAEFDTFEEAFKFAFPKQDEHNPYLVDSKILIESYSDAEY